MLKITRITDPETIRIMQDTSGGAIAEGPEELNGRIPEHTLHKHSQKAGLFYAFAGAGGDAVHQDPRVAWRIETVPDREPSVEDVVPE